MYSIITIAREYGSGGGSIAKALANRLGWDLLDRALITGIAQNAKVDPALAARYDERVDTWLDRLRKGTWYGFASMAEIDCFDAEKMARLAHHVIEEAASVGHCVIVGRGGQCVLQRRPDTFHVFIHAPWNERVRRVETRISPGENVEARIRAMDRERAEFIRTYYDQDWRDPHLYHLMISSMLGEETVVSAILRSIGK